MTFSEGMARGPIAMLEGRAALLRLWRQPGTLDVSMPDGAVWNPFAALSAEAAPPFIIAVEPGPETLRTQIDSVKKKQK